jgi:hypothetical protein
VRCICGVCKFKCKAIYTYSETEQAVARTASSLLNAVHRLFMHAIGHRCRDCTLDTSNSMIVSAECSIGMQYDECYQTANKLHNCSTRHKQALNKSALEASALYEYRSLQLFLLFFLHFGVICPTAFTAVTSATKPLYAATSMYISPARTTAQLHHPY